jgi:gliding motility-associated protein GldE
LDDLDSLFNPFSFEALSFIILLIVLLICSALISGSEIAYFSLSPSQLEDSKGRTRKSHKFISSLINIPKQLLATILIANNFVNVAIVILSTYLTTILFNLNDYPVAAFVIQVVVVTALILFAGEIMPKIYATQRPLFFAKFMARPLNVLVKILYPFSSVMVKSTSFIDKRMAGKGHRISRDELSEAIDITIDENIQEGERKILQGIVRFGDIDVKEIMKSRTDVTAVDVQMKFDELYKLILDAGYSRIPAYHESFDKVEGMLYIKDLLPYLNRTDDFNWQDLLRPAFFVPENKKINDLLKEFREKKIHFAIVVDEYGGTSGIVTLEDILEEIVGEITDEFDSRENEIQYEKIDDSNYLFEAKTTLNDFCKILNIDDGIFDEVKGDSDSLGGLILELIGQIPKKGENIPFENFVFKIEAVDNRRIKKIMVTINLKKKG